MLHRKGLKGKVREEKQDEGVQRFGVQSCKDKIYGGDKVKRRGGNAVKG